MDKIADFFGLSSLKQSVTVSEMDERIISSARNDQVACDVLNESRRKRGLAMKRCGEGLPSWEGQLVDKTPAWEDL